MLLEPDSGICALFSLLLQCKFSRGIDHIIICLQDKTFCVVSLFFFHKQKFARSRLNLNISVDIIAFHVLSKIVIVVLLVLTVSVRF